MSIKYITHKGKIILCVDYRNKNEFENLPTLEEAAKEAKTWVNRRPILSDFRGSTATTEFMTRIKQLGE
jgi:hypothetical protein